MIIHMGGAKGVGKTTVLRMVDWAKVIPVSACLFQIGVFQYGKHWQELNEEERNKARELFLRTLQRESKHNILLDSHYIDMKEGQPQPIMPRDISQIIDLHLVLEASPEEIFERRIKDYRERGTNLEEIRQEITSERVEAVRQSLIMRKPFGVINNHRVERALFELKETVNTLLPVEGGIKSEAFLHHIERE